MAVYGNNQVPMIEDMIPAPEDSYGIAKYAVEQELRVTREMFGLPYIIFRPHSVYGPRQNTGDRYRNVVGIFMNQILRGEPLSIFGTGEQVRAFSYVGDIAPIIAHSIENEWAYGQIFNVGADTPCTINELAEMVSRAMGVPLNVKHLQKRYEVFKAFTSHDKVRRYFKVPESTPLEVGLARMAKWAKSVGSREPSRFENIEVTKNLPPYWVQP
jgi:UDP-glucose 4-epimerase